MSNIQVAFNYKQIVDSKCVVFKIFIIAVKFIKLKLFSKIKEICIHLYNLFAVILNGFSLWVMVKDNSSKNFSLTLTLKFTQESLY